MHLSDDFHLRHLSMTALAVDAGGNVGIVGEVGVVGQPVNSLPRHWLALFVKLSKMGDTQAVDGGQPVAVHAGARCRDTSVASFLGADVAVLAGDVHVACVLSVGEGQRLGRRKANGSAIGRSHQCGNHYRNQDDADDERQANLDVVVQAGPERFHSRPFPRQLVNKKNRVGPFRPCGLLNYFADFEKSTRHCKHYVYVKIKIKR
jgi:hypothetical protein